jgi:hypothetical protein
VAEVTQTVTDEGDLVREDVGAASRVGVPVTRDSSGVELCRSLSGPLVRLPLAVSPKNTYVRQVTALAAPDTWLYIGAFPPGTSCVCRASTTRNGTTIQPKVDADVHRRRTGSREQDSVVLIPLSRPPVSADYRLRCPRI